MVSLLTRGGCSGATAVDGTWDEGRSYTDYSSREEKEAHGVRHCLSVGG